MLLGGALVAPLAVTCALGAIRGPTSIYVGPGTYWVGWLLIAVPLAGLLGVVLIVGTALALLRRNDR